MGLIKAAVGAAGGVMADQWKEFFYCESMPKEVLVTKGVKRTSGFMVQIAGMVFASAYLFDNFTIIHGISPENVTLLTLYPR